MSSRFSEIPYFILENFFNNLKPYGHVYPSSAVIHTMGHSIVAKGGYGVEIYLKNITPSEDELGYDPYYMVKCRNFTLDSRKTGTRTDGSTYDGALENTIFKFSFEPIETTYRGSEISYDSLVNYANNPDNSPVEVYFKKTHLLHDFIDDTSTYKDFVNTTKEYLYFGELFTIANDSFIVEYNGMMNYVMKALPEVNRTDNLQVFFEVFFDQLYSQLYNALGNILVQSDPYEMDAKYLYYLLSMYKVFTIHNMDVPTEREFIANIPSYLKRKGSFTSLYLIWYVLTKNTSNLLTVYERWHDWDIPDTPLEYFTDYPYLSYNSYATNPPIGGAGAAYYYRGAGASISTISLPTNIWTVIHNLNNTYPLVQCINDENKLVFPSLISYVDANILTAAFDDEAVSGYAICSQSETALYQHTHTQILPATTWTVVHNLDLDPANHFYPHVQVVNNSQQLNPTNIHFKDNNTLEIIFDEATEGVATVFSDPQTYTQDSNTGTSWIVIHNLQDHYPFVMIVDDNDEIMFPDEILFSDENTLIVSFSEASTGTAVIFSNPVSLFYPTYSPEVTGGCMSPHYRAELDLSSEPLRDDAIIDDTMWDDLLTYWNEMRPVCKFAHYSEVISPITDFSGFTRSLYNNPTKNGYLYSMCTEISNDASADCYVYTSNGYFSTWVIYHNFGTRALILDCYDINKRQIIPANTNFITTNAIIITFSTAVNGFAYVSKAEYDSGLIASSTEWEVDHHLGDGHPGEEFMVELQRKSNNFEFMPMDITMSSAVSASIKLFEPTAGYSVYAKREYYYTRSGASDAWFIAHNLNSSAVLTQTFNTSKEAIYPKQIIIHDIYSCTIYFETPQEGYAIIKKVGLDDTNMIAIADAIDHIEIGDGTSGRKWDPVINNMIESSIGRYELEVDQDTGKLYTEDANYYYLESFIRDEIEMNVTEIGVYDVDENLLFYTYMSPLNKPVSIGLTIWYRIEKRMR